MRFTIEDVDSDEITRPGTPLGRLHAQARIDRIEGVKTFVAATPSTTTA